MHISIIKYRLIQTCVNASKQSNGQKVFYVILRTVMQQNADLRVQEPSIKYFNLLNNIFYHILIAFFLFIVLEIILMTEFSKEK